jgi:hypothetical protein
MFGATYKNFHLTRYVYQICDALDMRALRGAPPPYRHGDLVVTQEEIVDSLGGAISGASFRNWRNYWVLAQEVMTLLAEADGDGHLSPKDIADWTQLNSLVNTPPCTETPIPPQYRGLARLTTRKYVQELTELKIKFSDVIVVDDDSMDQNYH